MTLEEHLYFIRTEFQKELDKRKKLLDDYAKIRKKNEQLERDLKAYRSFYLMKNEVCKKCMFADECYNAYNVEGRKFCATFHAKLESEDL